MIEYFVAERVHGYDVTKFDGSDQPTSLYHVAKGRQGFACSCPAFTRGKTRPCKHVKMVETFINTGGKKSLFTWEQRQWNPSL